MNSIGSKKIKVIGTAWHTGHQFYLTQLPFISRYDFVITNRTYAEKQRPFPSNSEYIPHIPDDHNYDLAILHVDQQVVEDGVSKGQIFFDLFHRVKQLGIPTIIINHMVPISDRLESEEVIAKMKRLIGDTPMITNSERAAEQWGWGKPIIHGMKSSDWWDLPKEPRIITCLSDGGMERAYRRRLLTDTKQILNEEYGEDIMWVGGDVPSRENFNDYRDFIGRSLIYFNPLWNSPMPRSRTEAMLSGACIVSTPYQDWEKYVRHGDNGYIVPDDAEVCARLLHSLLNDYEKTREVGQRGKRTAQIYFDWDRYVEDWYSFVVQQYPQLDL